MAALQPWLVLVPLLWPCLAGPEVVGAPSTMCRGSSCAVAEASRQDESLEMLQRSMGVRVREDRLVPTLPPFTVTPQCNTSVGEAPFPTKVDKDFLEHRRTVQCNWQTGGITCLNWNLVITWWLPLGHDYRGSFVFFLFLAILFVGSRSVLATAAETQEVATEKTARQVNFWCYDLPPHHSLYLAMAGATLWLATLLDHPTYSLPDAAGMHENLMPWWLIFMPTVVCMVVAGCVARQQRKLWHTACLLTMLPATFWFISWERPFTLADHHGHRYLIVSWIFFGISVALLALNLVPEAEANISSWLRKFAMLVCSVSYIAGGISKVLNSKPFLSWLDGEILRHYTYCIANYNNFRGIPYPWMSRQVATSVAWSQLFCVANLVLELPLSFAALFGLGCFGELGPVRILWCLAGCSFHFGVNLVWGCHQASEYNYETWTILMLVVDVCGKYASWQGAKKQPVQESKAAPAAEPASQLTLLMMSITCSVALFAWILNAFIHHFDDPKWPMTAVPMFSMKCGILWCDEQYRSTTYQLGWPACLLLSLAGTSMVMLRPASAKS